MGRLLTLLAFVGLAAAGLSWLADNPGSVTIAWRGVEYSVSLMVALAVLTAGCLGAAVAIALLRFLWRAPRLMTRASGVRRRDRGLAALSRGLVAVGAGDAREAGRAAREAERLLPDAALTNLLRAQAAQLVGDRPGAVAAFRDMLTRDETRMLGLRGLHIEARRAGEPDAAVEYAQRAHALAAPPWAAQAVLDDLATRGDWANALAAVESHARAGLLDKPTAARWRAVLKTALAGERAERDPKAALALAREALNLAPTFIPAVVATARLTAAAGDYKRAARLLENAYRAGPHPELADAYLRLRPGDSATERLGARQDAGAGRALRS